MNDFDPKHIHNASLYLQEKLKACKKRKQPAYVVEKKKESYLTYLINLLFKH
jgi:hypothetical protein